MNDLKAARCDIMIAWSGSLAILGLFTWGGPAMANWWTPYTTRCMIACLFVALVVWDVILAVFVGNEATESKQMQWIGLQWPIVILAWGGLSAHFFCPKLACWCGWWQEVKPMLILVLGFVGFRVAWAQTL